MQCAQYVTTLKGTLNIAFFIHINPLRNWLEYDSIVNFFQFGHVSSIFFSFYIYTISLWEMLQTQFWHTVVISVNKDFDFNN